MWESRQIPSHNIAGEKIVNALIFTPAVYSYETFIKGNPTDRFIFVKNMDNLVVTVILMPEFNDLSCGGSVPLASNTGWQVAKYVSVLTVAHVGGHHFLARPIYPHITFVTGASLNGRLLAQTAVIVCSNARRRGAGASGCGPRYRHRLKMLSGHESVRW